MANATTPGLKFDGLNATLGGSLTIPTGSYDEIVFTGTGGTKILAPVEMYLQAANDIYLMSHSSVNLTLGNNTATFAGDVTVNGGDITVNTTGKATLTLNGDSDNSGDAAVLDSEIKMLHDGGDYGMLLQTQNHSGRSSFKIVEKITTTETMRFQIDETGDATFAGDVDVTRSSTGQILSRVYNSNTSGTGTSVLRIANGGNQANGARLEFSDLNYYNATISVDRTNGMRFMVHDDSNSMADLLTHPVLTLATNKNATFAGAVIATGAVRVPYIANTKQPMIVLNGATNYGLFHTEASNDIFSFDFAGVSKHEFKQDGNATFAGTVQAPYITANDPSGAANGSAQEIARFVNTTSGATSSYMYIGASSGTDWRLGKNIMGTTSNTNFGITKHSGTAIALEIDTLLRTRLRSTDDYVLGLVDSGGTDQWWLKAYNSNGNFAIHENGVGDKFTIAAGGNATFAGTVTATSFTGDGANISNVYKKIYDESWGSTPEAKYIEITLPFISGSGASSYYYFDVLGYRDIGSMDSQLHYRVYLHNRANGVDNNDLSADVFAINEAASESFGFGFLEGGASSSKFLIKALEDYSRVAIVAYPSDAVLTSSMISSTETAPTGYTDVTFATTRIKGDVEVGGDATFAGNVTVSGTYPKIILTDTDNNPDFTIIGGNGQFGIYDETNSTYRLQINSSGNATFGGGITISKSVGDSVLTIEADTDNNNENDNPRIELKQDSGIIYGHFGINGDANATFTGAGANSTYIRAAGGLDIATDGSTKALTIDNSQNATFAGDVEVTGTLTIDGDGASNAEITSSTASSIVSLNVGGFTGTPSLARDVRFFTNSASNSRTERMRITSDGKVGIGTDSPSYKLHIEDASDDFIRLTRTSVRTWGHRVDSSGRYNLRNITGTYNAFVVDSSNRVGLGVNPLTELHVKASSGFAEVRMSGASGSGSSLEFYENTTALADIYANTSKDLIFRNNGTTERMRILSGGNVAIGRTTADEKLHVGGTGKFDGDLHFGGAVLGQVYRPVESGSATDRFFLMFDYTNNASYPFLTNRTPNGAVVVKTGTAAGGGENEHFRIKGGDGTVDAYFTNVNLGIGTNSPLGKLEISSSNVIGSVNGGADELVIQNNGYSGISILSNNANAGQILFGDNDANVRGQLQYWHSDDSMRFGTSASERMRITSGGSLQMAGTGTDNDSYAITFKNGACAIARDNNDLELHAYDNMVFGVSNTSYPTSTERMRIASDGKVGIGTTSPSKRLHVYQTGNNQPLLVQTDDHVGIQVKGGNSHDRYISFQQANGSVGSKVGWDHSSQTLKLNAVDSFASTHLAVDVNGNVGIGTALPDAKLMVNTADQLIARFKSSNTGTTGIRIQGVDTSASDAVFVDWVYDAENRKYGFGEGTASGELPINSGLSHCDIVFDDAKVGIGTDSPQAALHVAGAFNSTSPTGNGVLMGYYLNAYGYIQLNGTSGGYIDFSTSGTDHKGRILYDNTNNYLRFDTDGAERVRITSGGNVGIGTTSPAGKFNSYISATRQLTHNGNGGDLSIISDNNSTPVFYVKGTGTADLVNVFDNTSEVFTILDGGNVGIATSSPDRKLHVTGDDSDGIKISGGTNGRFIELSSSNLNYYTTSSGGYAMGQRILKNSDSSVLGAVSGAYGTGSALTYMYYGGTAYNDAAMYILPNKNIGIGTNAPARDLHLKKSNSGGQVRAEVFNTSNTANSHGIVSIYSGGASAGDPFLHWKVEGIQDWSMGIDNSDSDKLKISKNFGPGTNDYLSIDTSGNATFAGNVIVTGEAQLVSNLTTDNTVIYENDNGTRWQFGSKALTATNKFGGRYHSGSGWSGLLWSINSSGNVAIAGSLSKGSGSFKIDHPLESKKDTHDLVHSFIEGPQADLIYRGKVDLVDGQAEVNIDTEAGMTEGTFVLLNTNVQCFTTNESNWDLVKGSVSGNILTIESQNTSSTATISWMVVGERQDQHMIDTDWTDDNGKIIVEPRKVE